MTRYIYPNPVIAGITDAPTKYSWSSYSSYEDKASNTQPDVIHKAEILSYFAVCPSTQKRRYKVFVEEGIVLRRERAELRREIARFRKERPVQKLD